MTMRFLGGYILSLECRWKGGRLSKIEVIETLNVRLPTCLP
jgi:hypothetical protein